MNDSNDLKEKVSLKIDEMHDEIVGFCSELIRIPSVTPTYLGVDKNAVEGGETRLSQRLASEWRATGFKVDVWDALPGRANAVGRRKGSGGGRSLMLIGHVDVVPVPRPEEWKHHPFGGEVHQGRIYGRGAVDMKGGLAAMTMAVRALSGLGVNLRGDVVLAGTVGEETMDGAKSVPAVVDRGYKTDAAIHAEPSDTVQPACGGLLWLKITLEGKSTHSLFRYELIRAGGSGLTVGVSAVDKAFKIYSALRDLEEEWGLTKRHHLLPAGHSTIGANVIKGGPGEITTPFIIPDSCTLDYCVWYPPQFKVEEIKEEIEDQIRAATVNDSWLVDHPPRIEWVLHWPPFLTPEDHEVVKTVVSAHRTVTGEAIGVSSSLAVNDGAFTSLKGIPSLAYGAGGEGLPTAHAVDEFVKVEDLLRATKVLAISLLNWCGKSNSDR